MNIIARPLVVFLAFTTVWAEEAVNLSVVQRIRSEALDRSRVMEYAFYLTDVHGPRLTNSPGFHAAADWAVKELAASGLANVKVAVCAAESVATVGSSACA